MEIVNEILEREQKKAEKYKSITVDKHLELDYDIGTLLASDSNDLDTKLLKSKKDEYLLSLSRDNTQLLLNKVWELPTERIEEAIVVRLPVPTTVLPRAKPVPKPKPLTKWQEFAKAKGITKKKKDKLEWDEQLQKWVPLYGFRKAAAEKEKNWVIEVPQNVDPMTDMYEKKATEKSEKVAKNELQRLKNIARARKVKIPRVGLPVTSDKASSTQLNTAALVAKASTASLGKFQDKLPKEKEARGIGIHELIPGKERKRKAPIPTPQAEKQHNLNLLDSILNKRPKIDMEKAITKHINNEQVIRSEEKKTMKPLKGGKRKGKGNATNFSAKKPKGGKGQRNPSKKNPGRKRR
ncbi:ribosome biogenesis regulatory protein homolog [Plodia interpunctella]|uniref:ribosome biogenesis regulatory protein homolog n=1 Tax=Plodia interpunctella TaxID=58824 RepID=UPI002368EF54|nr:ribosome biogenesis regulatory protein homolog [Plodia interpunctella]